LSDVPVNLLFEVDARELRRELADDLRRSGYVRRPGPDGEAEWYFDKHVALARPAILRRAARLLAGLLPEDAERLVVTDLATSALGTALSQETGIELLFGIQQADGLELHGEPFSGMKAVLLEDVVLTGGRALTGAEALARCGATVVCVLCLLDRRAGGGEILAEGGYTLRSLYDEGELLAAPEPTAF
jgi:orotate phosphoribosyltransferase